jgi:hypothetical protein
MTYDQLKGYFGLYRLGKLTRCELVAAIGLWQISGARCE